MMLEEILSVAEFFVMKIVKIFEFSIKLALSTLTVSLICYHY
jgi:hypothetical protein